MGVDKVPEILSRIATRVVAAPAQIAPPRPSGGTTSQQRYREGLLDEAGLRQELAGDGYTQPDIERLVHQAILERDLDNFTDRIAIITDSYNKDILTDEQMQVQVRALIVDPVKAQLAIDKLRFAKAPKPQAPKAATVPTLTTAQLMAAWAAGLLTEADVRAELLRRGYSELDAGVLLALQASKQEVQPAPAAKQLSIANLNAMLPLGLITPQDYVDELVSRGYTENDAEALLGLQIAKASSKAPSAPAPSVPGL